MNKIWKLKYQNGTWVVLYHPNRGEYTDLSPDDLADVFKTKPTAEDMLTQIWADDLIERYLSLENYSEANQLIEKYRLPCKK
jgi:hypothetical protein